LVVLIDGDRGGDGDLYELVIPACLARRAGRQDWRGGKLHALRPVFLELGIPAALVYETLEQARDPLASFELITASGLSRSAVYTALETLSAFNLADQRGGRWSVVATTSLTVLAEQFGVLETIRKTVQRHRDERAAYRSECCKWWRRSRSCPPTPQTGRGHRRTRHHKTTSPRWICSSGSWAHTPFRRDHSG